MTGIFRALSLRADFGMVHNDFSMEYFLSIFHEIVGNGSDKCTLGQVGNLWKPMRSQSCANGGGYIPRG